MYNSESYGKEIATLEAGAKKLENEWTAQNPSERATLLKKYPSPIRPYQPNWIGSPPKDTIIPDYPPCPRCGAPELKSERVLDGVRHNGDGYGARYDICQTCGWTVWWLYDEA